MLAVIKQVRRPRTVVVSDPRRNHLIARDGDKDDALDAQKLLELARRGYVRQRRRRTIRLPSNTKGACMMDICPTSRDGRWLAAWRP